MITNNDLIRARDTLNKGGVVGMPTETVYGLAARIDSPQGLKKIFQLKERPFFDPLIVHISDLKQVRMLAKDWSPIATELANHFWPGPLTIVVPKLESVDSIITAGLDTVGIRFPKHPIAHKLIELVGMPLAAPSANKFKKTSPTTRQHVVDEFAHEEKDLLVLEGGHCEVGLESTVVRILENEIEILRPGFVTEEIIREFLKQKNISGIVRRQQSVHSPGHMSDHYMPAIPLVIIDENEELDNLQLPKKLGMHKAVGKELFLSEDPVIVARELYNDLRQISQSGAQYIYLRKKKKQVGGFWSAIWDRLNKAAQIDLTSK